MTSSTVTDLNYGMTWRIERIQNHKNVQGLVLVNSDGNPVRSNMDNSTSLQYTRHTEELRGMTQHVVRDLDPEDDLVVLRLRTKMNEVMVLPGEWQP